MARRPQSPPLLRRLILVLVGLLLLAVIAGVTFVAVWDLPAPVTHVEKVLPNDRFIQQQQ